MWCHVVCCVVLCCGAICGVACLVVCCVLVSFDMVGTVLRCVVLWGVLVLV